MLIENYDLDVKTIPCEPGAAAFSATVRLKVDISPALPYLNRVLRGAMYNTQAPSLAWTDQDNRKVAFWAYKIAIGSLDDRAQAEKVAKEIVDLVNSTWERRDEIEPDHEMHKRSGPMEIFKLLPRTNCKACGEATCFVFANKLAAGQVELERCTPLAEPQYAEQRVKLAGLLAVDLPAIGPRA